MLPLSALGPNVVALALLLLLAAGAAAHSLWQLHNARPVRALPLAVALVLPLLLALWASHWQLPAAMAALEGRGLEPLAANTLEGAMLARSLATELYAALGVALIAAATTLGAIALTVPGERPRKLIGASGLVVGTALLAAGGIGFALVPALATGLRVLLYAVLIFAMATALVAAHRRGPGVQLATVAAVVFPVFIASVDLATLALVATDGFMAVAMAEEAARSGILQATREAGAALRSTSMVHLALATGLALLGPIAAWSREHDLALGHSVALGLGVVATLITLGASGAWLAP